MKEKYIRGKTVLVSLPHFFNKKIFCTEESKQEFSQETKE